MSILPILIVLFLVLAVKIELIYAVGLFVVILLIGHRYSWDKIWQVSLKSISVKTILMIWGIMVFKQALIDTQAVTKLSALLMQTTIPDYAVFGLLSFFIGLLTGLNPASLTIVLPVALIYMEGQVNLSLVVLIYIAGFTGNMLSPTHLCLALTVDFFKIDMRKLLRMLVGPEMGLLIFN